MIPTPALPDGQRSAVRRLLDDAFDGDFSDDDWEHALGGLHFLAVREDTIVAHAAVVQRSFFHADRAWRCGYVEAVAVHPAWRRQGLAGEVMAAAEQAIDRAYDFGALSASDAGRALYESRGWLPWRGRTAVLSPAGLSLTPDDDDSTFVRGGPLDLDGLLACDWRNGDVW
ncbi:aminoglycoside 2'-N-acetyltransferase [Paractinoplanes abujensis]|uniref:Aminoglycoside 2'-N-acetyltransferase I n=1 Tax=Paractinoplanes abujensis TaxID=882441 RepID=A0A7W7CLP7_9ACTN|nr:GNAT family N-acetyltransferase [Actinoplanes abujensis]MBB4690856.1 aminoglycoside 2'-N-acetyltransferase I [Actinoplanes abujensis]GID17731.1 aminoglycoside 2'-N-acetyltransferase [Actinoplanes abujensis]